MGPFFRGLAGELVGLVRGRRLVLLLLLLGSAWASLEVYHRAVLHDLPVAMVDLDGSHLSRTVRLFVDATPEVRAIDTSLADAEEGLAAGRFAGVVVIPGGFSAAVKDARPAPVHVRLDMSNILTGRTAQKAIARAVGTVSAGASVAVLEKLGDRKEQRLGHAQPVRIDDRAVGNPALSYAVYLGPGLALSLLHVFVLILAGSIRLPPRPSGSAGETAGREAGVLVAALALGALLTYGFLAREGVAPASGPGLVGSTLALFLVADLALVRAAFALVPRPLAALQFVVILGVLSLPLSGLTFPRDAFPAALRAAAGLVPFTPFSHAFRIYLHHRAVLADLGPDLLKLGGQALGYTLVGAAALRLRRPRRPEVP